MSIDPSYEPMYKRARELQFRFHDVVDDPNHPSAHLIKREMQNLMDDLETRKSPRNIEERIKHIQHGIMEARNVGDHVMDYEHSDHFHRSYEDMRRDVRRFHDYS